MARKSAFNKALQEAQSNGNTVPPSKGEVVVQLDRETASQPQGETVALVEGVAVPPHQGKTVKQAHSDTVKKDKKVTFYLTQEQVEKLQDLEMEMWQRHKKVINRNEIVRYLINHCTADNLVDLA